MPAFPQTSAKPESFTRPEEQRLGAEVWRGDKPPAERGFVTLGVPIGHEDFVLDLVVYGATPNGVTLCCDATLVFALTRNGLPAHAADSRDGTAIAVARWRKAARYPELGRGGPQRLCVLAAEVGGRWGDEAQQLVRQFVRLRGRQARTALRAAAAQGWVRRWWWGILAVAVQRAVCSAVLGNWSMPAIPADADAIPLPRCQAGCRCAR